MNTKSNSPRRSVPTAPPHAHLYELLIREHHLDTFGHVNNATYLQLLEEARWQWITEGGYGLDTIQKTGLGPTILDLSLQFRKEIRLRDSIKISSWVPHYEGKVGTIQQLITREDDTITTIAKFTFGLFSIKERALVEPTAEWQSLLLPDHIDS